VSVTQSQTASDDRNQQLLSTESLLSKTNKMITLNLQSIYLAHRHLNVARYTGCRDYVRLTDPETNWRVGVSSNLLLAGSQSDSWKSAPHFGVQCQWCRDSDA